MRLMLLLLVLMSPVYAADYTRQEGAYTVPNVKVVRNDLKAVNLKSELSDKPVVLTFIYTTCKAICPMLTGTLKGIQAKLGDIHLVSITLDPEYDKPQKLQDYATQIGANSNWNFYQASMADTIMIEKAFGAYKGDKMNHTNTIYIHAPNKPWVRLDGFMTSSDVINEYQKL